jgi:hypothetical protein
VRVETAVDGNQHDRRDRECGEHKIAHGVSEVLDRITGDDRSREVPAGIAEPERREIACAFLRRPERAAERLVRDVEENEARPHEDCRSEKRWQCRPYGRQHEADGEHEDAADHRSARAQAIRDASGIHAEEQREDCVDADEEPDRERTGAELERKQ